MKRALVISLLVLGFGIGVAAQSISGAWSTDIVFQIDAVDNLEVRSLTSILDVDYALSGWAFGFNLFVDMDELFDLNLDLTGVLGAFSLYSFLDFDPALQTPSFTSWENLVRVSIAGVELWGAFVLQDVPGNTIGTGWALGGHGVAGDIEVWVEADFNVGMWGYSPMFWIQIYGWDILHDWGTYFDCSDGEWYSGVFTVLEAGCTPAFSNLDIVIEAPFTCLDFIVWANFDCENGFDYVKFSLNDIDIGGGWFQLDDLDITFTAISKTVSTDFSLTLGDAVCVTPYLYLNHGVFDITGITLRALLLSYSYNGVTIKAGELFSDDYYVGFTKAGALTRYVNCSVTGADEFIGVWFDGDSCCGGLTSASVVTFFDSNLLGGGAPDDVGIFGFVLITANVEIGIGSGFSINLGLDVADEGLDSLSAGFTFAF